MFKRKAPTAGLTYIANGTKIAGETYFAGDALVAGQLNGLVVSEGMITIDNGGFIEGDTQCHEIKISGHYKGKLFCEKLIITGTGILEGEVTSTQMEIYEGGQFIGVRNQGQKQEITKQTKSKKKHQDILPPPEAPESKIAH